MIPSLKALTDRWREEPSRGIRVAAFGSSNTEMGWHNHGRFSWSAWLEASLRNHVGKHVSQTNLGICGETVLNLHDRFDRDVVPLRPDLVIVTIGCNDRWKMPLENYRDGLRRLVDRITAINATPVLQTYYSVQLPGATTPDEPFDAYMQAMRDVAREAGVACVDTHPRFRAWHAGDEASYVQLLQDTAHLNGLGHLVFGTFCVRAFGLPEPVIPVDLEADYKAAMATAMRFG